MTKCAYLLYQDIDNPNYQYMVFATKWGVFAKTGMARHNQRALGIYNRTLLLFDGTEVPKTKKELLEFLKNNKRCYFHDSSFFNDFELEKLLPIKEKETIKSWEINIMEGMENGYEGYRYDPHYWTYNDCYDEYQARFLGADGWSKLNHYNK